MAAPAVVDAAEADAFAAEQIRTFFKETGIGNLLGAVVISFTVWAGVEFVPRWTWMPALGAVYCATAIRAWLLHRYWKNPAAKTPARWGLEQTFLAGIAGAGWGFANTAMCAYLPVEHQLLVASVAAVAVSFSAAEGFAYMPPPRAFIAASLVPLTLWFYTGRDHLHLTLGIMLTIYVPAVLWQTSKRHRAFVASMQLRFRNEFLARELARQKDIAETAARSKARFLAAASHDLRQPVQALTFFQELIRSEMTLTAKGEEYFAKERQAVQAVSGLLDSLLDISRLDANTIEVLRERLPVAELFDQMRAEFTALAKQQGIELRFARSSAVIETDSVLFGRLVRNLIANALRYTPSGKVLVGCRRRPSALAIQVLDTGIGIHPDHQRAIFGEFFQVANPERDRRQGLGLGLSIVERIAGLLGATVSLRSTPGKGSCFSVSLPCRADAAQAPLVLGAADSMPATAADLAGRRIVVVENEEAIRNAIRTLLEGWGCEVIAAASGSEIWLRVDSGDTRTEPGIDAGIDAAISDFGLSSEENGIGVIRDLRARLGRELPALLITGDTSPAVLRAARDARLRILHKPVRPEELRQALSGEIANFATMTAS